MLKVASPKVAINTDMQRRAAAELELRNRELVEEAESWTLHQYIPKAWPIVEPSTTFVDNWHIAALSEHLTAVTDGQIKNLIINIQPRHMKSLVVAVFWMTWAWTKQPHLRWLFSAYAEGLSIRDSLKCRRIIQSNWYQVRYGHIFQLVGDQNAKSRYENDKTGVRLATGVGGSATGEGGNILVIDDPIKLENAFSIAKREEVIEWWDGSMSTRHNDPATGSTVVMMQRTHSDDLTGHLIRKMKEGGRQYEMLILPTEYEPARHCVTSIGWEDPRKGQPAGTLIWPLRFDYEFIQQLKKDLGPYKASAQLQQNPSPIGGGIFKESWFGFWQPKGWGLGPVYITNEKGEKVEARIVDLPDLVESAQTWDFTFKDAKTSSPVSGQVWGFSGSGCFLLDEIHGHMDIVASIEAIRRLTHEYPEALTKLVEDKANGPAIMQLLSNEIPGLISINPMGDKVSRAHAVVPLFWAGNVFLPHPDLDGMFWVWDYLEEFSIFPKGRKDRVDAASQLLALLLKPVSERRLITDGVRIGAY